MTTPGAQYAGEGEGEVCRQQCQVCLKTEGQKHAQTESVIATGNSAQSDPLTAPN